MYFVLSAFTSSPAYLRLTYYIHTYYLLTFYLLTYFLLTYYLLNYYLLTTYLLLTFLLIYLLIYLLTYLLTPYSTVLLEKLTCLQLVKKFATFYGTRRFITALTTALHLSLS